MKKIITYISPFGFQFDPNAAPEEYICPDGGVVYGRQTNEAPVRCLLRQDPEISQVICILSKLVRREKKGVGLIPWEYFKTETENWAREAFGGDKVLELVPIFFEDEGENKETFEENLLERILKRIDPSDEIYLDTTGGPRDVATQLLLLSRVLQYQDTKILGVVYSNFNLTPHRIEDITSKFFDSFDLLNGLNEFQHFCNTRSLRQYYEDAGLGSLLKAMENLSECIILCRTASLNKRIKVFQKELDKAQVSRDPLLQVLLPIFRKKFDYLNSIPSIIRWCLDNNLIQQALTIYNERIPEYLIVTKGFLTYPDKLKAQLKDQQNFYSAVLTHLQKGVFSLGKKMRSEMDKRYHSDYLKATGRDLGSEEDNGVYTIEYLKELFPVPDLKCQGFCLKIKPDTMQEICLDYIYIKTLRNHVNHDMGEPSKHALRNWYLTKKGYSGFDKYDLPYVRDMIQKALERIENVGYADGTGNS